MNFKYFNIFKTLLVFIILIVYLKILTKLEFEEKIEISIILKPKCDCSNQIINVTKLTTKYIIQNHKNTYELPNNFLFTCDTYKTLKRGLNQRVIAYSLYGNDSFYYKYVYNLSHAIEKFYPGFVMRIYHDDTINKSLICDLECKKPHVDFCNIKSLPQSFDDLNLELDVDYIHSMMWRFLPIGDSFVDLFMSRDTDSPIHSREVYSVKEWLESNNIGHIMRDNPNHGTEILGGMWGFKNSLNRSLARETFDLIINKEFSKKYSSKGVRARGGDQEFLSQNLYYKINKISTIHDSYTCKTYEGSKPFPTKRKGNCFVGVIEDCDENGLFYKCPDHCKPKEHPEWEFC